MIDIFTLTGLLIVGVLSLGCGFIGRSRGDSFLNWFLMHTFYAGLWLPLSLMIFGAMLFSTAGLKNKT